MFGLEGEILTRMTQVREMGRIALTADDAELKLGATRYGGEDVLWQWAETTTRDCAVPISDVIALEADDCIRISVGLIHTTRHLEQEGLPQGTIPLARVRTRQKSLKRNGTYLHTWIVIRKGALDMEDPMHWPLVKDILHEWQDGGAEIDIGKWRTLWEEPRNTMNMRTMCTAWTKKLALAKDWTRRFYGKWNRETREKLRELCINEGRALIASQITRNTVKLILLYYEKVKGCINLPTSRGGQSRTERVMFAEDEDSEELEDTMWNEKDVEPSSDDELLHTSPQKVRYGARGKRKK
jgi:hypothetical protein